MQPPTTPAAVTVFEAERIAGPDGTVERGQGAISDQAAVSRLKAAGRRGLRRTKTRESEQGSGVGHVSV